MGDVFFTLLGIAILLFVTRDSYITILHARGRSGPIGELLCRSIWSITRWVGFRLPRQRRHLLLNRIGPMLMPLLVASFIILLIIGFGLIYFPRMPEDFTINPAVGSRPWIDSLYFSGTTLTTVGFGDIAPRTMSMRLTSLFQAASGFGLISLSISYLVAVYRALERKRAVALSFYHQAEGGADVVGFISHHFVAGRFRGISANLRMAARDLQETLESHIEHPIIHYFHPAQVYKGMPRVLFLALEVCAVIRSCLDEDEYPEIRDHAEVLMLESTARHVLSEFTGMLGLAGKFKKRAETQFEESQRWKARFEQTLHGLNEVGIKTQSDTEQSWQIYQSHRDEWEPRLYQLARFLGYDWDEVTGDRDLQYAANENLEQPRVNDITLNPL